MKNAILESNPIKSSGILSQIYFMVQIKKETANIWQ